MSTAGRDRGSEQIYGIWQDSQDLISYRYLGCSSELQDREHAEGRMRLRRDMRAGAGLLSAPVAIAMLDTAGINIDRYYHAAPTQIDVNLLDAATDVDELMILGLVVREARTQVFTEARFVDARQPERIIGFGTVGWAIIGPTPDGFQYTDPGPGVADTPDLPSLPEAYDARPHANGGYVIDGLSSRVGTDSLHHGPTLVTLEATALAAASNALGDEALRVVTASTRLIRAARGGPFVTSAEVVGVVGDTITCRAEMRDQQRDDGVVAVAILTLQRPALFRRGAHLST